MISVRNINATVWQTHLALNLRWEYGPYHIHIEIYGFQFRTVGLPTVHSALQWIESATGKSPKKRGLGNKARYILHAYRKCGGAHQDEREPRDEGEEKQKPAHMEGFETKYTPRKNGRSRRRAAKGGGGGAAKQGGRGVWGEFLRFPALRHSTLSPLGIHVDRSEPDVIWLHSHPCPGTSPVLWCPGDSHARQYTCEKRKKKKCLAAVKRGSDTASRDTALWLRTYYRRTLVSYC